MNSRNIKEFFAASAFMIAAMVLSALAGLYMIGWICATAAVSFVMLRGRMREVILSMILVFAIDSALSFSFSFTVGLIVCLSAFGINIAVRARQKLLGVVAAGVLGIILAAAACFTVAEIANLEGMRLTDVKMLFNTMIGESVSVFEQAGVFSGYTQEDITLMENLLGMTVVPVGAIMAFTLYSYFATAILKKLMKRAKSDLCSGLADFTQLRADKMCFAILALSFAVYLFATASNQVIGAAAFCMFFILGAFYYVCGISVMSFFAKNSSGGRKAGFVLLTVLMAVFMFFSLVLIGIVDSFANIRKFGRENTSDGQ